MSWSNFIPRHLRQPFFNRQPRSRPLAGVYRPRLEACEGRFLPSTFTVINLGDAGIGSGLQGDLRYAVNTANANPDLSNRVVFAPGLAGTISLTQGPLAVTKNLEVLGPGQDALTVSGSHRSGVFNITADPRVRDVRLSDLTIADGTGVVNPGSGSPEGGGIRDDHAALTLTRVAVTGNAVSGFNRVFGGGIYVGTGNLTLNASTVAGNRAEANLFGSGGGIYSVGVHNVTLTDSVVDGNVATSEAGIDNLGGTLILLRSTISNNTSMDIGGASAVLANTLTMTDSTVTGNVTQSGDTIIVASATVADSQITDNMGSGIVVSGGQSVLTGTTVSGNVKRGLGGGVVSDRGDTQIINSTIVGNVGTSGGGGIYYTSGSLEVTSSTVTGNFADGASGVGGGGILIAASGDDRVLLRNTIVAGNNSASSRGPDVRGDVISIGYNLIGTRDDSTGWRATDLTGTLDRPIDPLLGPLQDNGGPTPTMAPLLGSPAIGAGDPALSATRDQRGAARYVLFPTIGAVGVVGASRFEVIAPAQVAPGEPFAVTVVAVNDAGFVATTYTGRVHFSSTDLDAQLPDDTAFSGDDAGVHTFSVTLATPGQQAIGVVDAAVPFVNGTVTLDVTDASAPGGGGDGHTRSTESAVNQPPSRAAGDAAVLISRGEPVSTPQSPPTVADAGTLPRQSEAGWAEAYGDAGLAVPPFGDLTVLARGL